MTSPKSNYRQMKPFEQEQEGGNLSPLRSSSKWEEVHHDAMRNYAMRTSIKNNSHNNNGASARGASRGKSLDATQPIINGHKKCYYQELSSIVRSRLAGLMITVAEEEVSIERQRQSLCRLIDFEPYAAFSRIDRENKGYICGKEIKDFLVENGYHHLLEAETNYIIKYFDSCPSEHPFNRLDYQE